MPSRPVRRFVRLLERSLDVAVRRASSLTVTVPVFAGGAEVVHVRLPTS
jgi:hypothetical protein